MPAVHSFKCNDALIVYAFPNPYIHQLFIYLLICQVTLGNSLLLSGGIASLTHHTGPLEDGPMWCGSGA